VVQGVGPEFKPQYCKKKKKGELIGRLLKEELKSCVLEWEEIFYL
jgi:hypothetical protein